VNTVVTEVKLTLAEQRQTLRVQELARLLGVSPSLVYREARLGRLAHFRVGRTVRIPADAAEEFMRKVRVEAQGK
jgi:excisionase family DNA binding protein